VFFRSKPPIRRTGKGIALELGRAERQLLELLTGELQVLLVDHPDDPGLRRLFPTAYHDDPQRDAEYQILARSELTDARLQALVTVQETLSATTLSDEQLQAWMTTINQLRLVLGTRLDIGEDDEDIDPDDPDGQERLVYHWLSGVLAMIIDAATA